MAGCNENADRGFAVDVLGTSYVITQSNEVETPMLKECDAFCDVTVKKIVLCDIAPRIDSVEDLDEYGKKVLRHELVHAFAYESGLGHNSWANNEEIVDWIAIQFPKILKVFEGAKCL